VGTVGTASHTFVFSCPDQSVSLRSGFSFAIDDSILLWEDLAAQIKHRQRAWNTDSLTSGENGQIPATDKTDKAKTAGDVEQLVDVLDVSLSGGMANAEVGRGDEREEHDEPEEGQCEEHIDTEGTHEEDETCDSPVPSQQLLQVAERQLLLRY